MDTAQSQETPTPPNHPTEEEICAVRLTLRSRGVSMEFDHATCFEILVMIPWFSPNRHKASQFSRS